MIIAESHMIAVRYDIRELDTIWRMVRIAIALA